jgi:hypothetical protein
LPRQARAHWILLRVKPFLRITFFPAQPVVKRMRLPKPIGMVMRFAETAFPKRNPPLDGEMQIARAGE